MKKQVRHKETEKREAEQIGVVMRGPACITLLYCKSVCVYFIHV